MHVILAKPLVQLSTRQLPPHARPPPRRRAGIFNAFQGLYQIKLLPPTEQPYLAVLSMRHPNVSTSFRVVAFHVAAVTNPEVAEAKAAAAAAAAAAAVAAASGVGSASAAPSLAQLGPVFNPLTQPRVGLLVALPALTAAAYGGEAKLVADFRAIVASNAALQGPEWVAASLVNSTPAVVNATVGSIPGWLRGSLLCRPASTLAHMPNCSWRSGLPASRFRPPANPRDTTAAPPRASPNRQPPPSRTLPPRPPQLWFPQGFATIPSAFDGLCALDYFLFLATKLPKVAFTKDGVVGFDVTGVQVCGGRVWGERSMTRAPQRVEAPAHVALAGGACPLCNA